jgi:hypothetical protein
MRALLVPVVVLSCAAGPSKAPVPKPVDVAELLARLGRAVDCDHKPSAWCVAVRGWAGGTAPAIPDGVLAGVTIGVERDKPDAAIAGAVVTFSAFAARDGKVFVTDIPPVDAAEQRALDAAAAAVADVLAGRSPRAELPASLVALMKTVPAKYPVARAGGEWRYAGEADGRIRRVGDAWVVIEVPRVGPEGAIVSIYTDRFVAKKLPH